MASTKDALTGFSFSPLSTTEQRTLESLSRGLSKKSISNILGISRATVEENIDSLKSKFDAGNSKQLVARAVESGIIRKPSSWAKGATLPPHNPFMGPPGTSSMHANSASSDATLNPGPGAGGNYTYISNLGGNLGGDLSNVFPYALPTILMPKSGVLIGVGVGNGLSAGNTGGPKVPAVLVMSPLTLQILASTDGSSSPQLTAPEYGHLSGGIYSFLDKNDNLVLVDAEGFMNWYSVDYNASNDTANLSLIESININQPSVATINPDYKGRIWYATEGSIEGMKNVSTTTPPVVGFYDPKSKINKTFTLGAGEIVANSISSSPAGVAVVSTENLYLFKYNKKKDTIEMIWQYQYGNSGDRKPGQLSAGTGATPVFFGPKTGYEYVAITDNSVTNGTTPAENFCVVDTRTGELVDKLPFLTPANSGTENAPIAVGKSVFSPSTYQYWYPPSSEWPSNPTPSATYDFIGGAQRVDLTGKGKGRTLQSQWTSDAVSAALPRLSIPDELIYTITASYNNAGWFSGEGVQYNFAAIDALTGEVVIQYPLKGMTDNWDGAAPQTGTISNYNTNPLQMTGVISPDGVFYQGLASGIIAVGGPRARFGTGITNDGYSFTDSISYDGKGSTYSADAIDSSDISQWEGPVFNIQGDGVNGLNFTWANGQSIKIDGEGSNMLTLFGSSVNGQLEDVNLTVNYTDGSSSNWIQSFSDWTVPSNYSGEAIYSTQSYMNVSDGTTDNTDNYIYAYQYSLEAGKEVESITLPFEYNLRVLDIAVSSLYQVGLTNTNFAITTPGWQVGNHQGFDNNGNYYSSDTIAGDKNINSYMPLSWNGVTFNIGLLPTSNNQVGGKSGPPNVLKTNGSVIDLPNGSFDKLYIAAAGSNGNQSGDIILNWADGSSSTTWSQEFSDWRNNGSSTAPAGVPNQEVIIQGQVVNQTGTATKDPNWIYGYSYDLGGKILDSITLPDNDNIGILGITLM